jgi:metallophosphoesterase (TIGR00282 family)
LRIAGALPFSYDICYVKGNSGGLTKLAKLRVLFIGEIVGKCGVFCVKKLLPGIRRELDVDVVIANADGATGGFGLGKNHAIYLHKLGVNIITAGDCIYYKRDMAEYIQNAPYILRAANYPKENPGRGWMIYEKDGSKLAVISLLGLAGFSRIHLFNPFQLVTHLVEKIKKETDTIIIDFHASTTSEKYSMFYYMGGKVSAIIGTHAKVLTADEAIFNDTTAVICDAGRTGSNHSVGGLDPEVEVRKYLTQVPEYSKTRCLELELQGVMMEFDEKGRATSIERVKRTCEEEFDGNTGENNSH